MPRALVCFVLRLCALLLVLLPAGSLSAEGGATPDEAQVGSEAAVYFDTNGVVVITPSAQGSLRYGRWTASGSHAVDIISAASVDIVSTASPRWQEVRNEGSLGIELEHDSGTWRVSGETSVEPDYISLGGRVAYQKELAGPGALLGLGLAYARDEAGRTGTPFSVYVQELSRFGWVTALDLTLDRSTLFQIELDGAFEVGDSSKPYRFLPLFAPDVASTVPRGASLAEVNLLRLPGRTREAVPLDRGRFAFTARLLRRIARTTLSSSLRAYADDWALFGLTSEVRAYYDLREAMRLSGFGRVHTQTGVYFWQRAYAASIADGSVTLPRYRTGDRELGPLLTGTLGLGIHLGLDGGADPFRTELSLQLDQQLTSFVDALFLEGRYATLALVQLGRQF